MVYTHTAMEEQAVLQTAAAMCAAARTAPKALGVDMIHTLVLTGEDKIQLVDKMEQMGTQTGMSWYRRDAANVRAAQAVVLIGVKREQRQLLQCGLCGFADCTACQQAGGTCAFAHIDLGIAVAAAVGVAAAAHIDNRIMYSIGKASAALAYAPDVDWLGIPLSISGKNIFFDRPAIQ